MIKEKKDLITSYITEQECEYTGDSDLFECFTCSSLNECYTKSCEICNSEFANSVNYGGCNTEEEYWNQIFD